MRKIQIITDSCSDLGKDIREKYDIAYARMNVVVHGEEKVASLDWDEYSPKELYDIMRNGERVTTTQVPSTEFISVFTKYLEAGCDIIYIGCSGALSGSVNTARAVAKELSAKYPDAKIVCIDPLISCLGEGMLTIKAAEQRDAGKSVEEITEYIENIKLCANQFVTVNSLDALKRAGRVKGSAAFFGNLFGVKPIIVSDINGQNVPVKKVKGRQASMDEIVNMLKEAMTDPQNETVYIAHADCSEDAEYLKNKVREVIAPKNIYVNYIGPIIGASIGPGAVAMFGMGKEVTIAG